MGVPLPAASHPIKIARLENVRTKNGNINPQQKVNMSHFTTIKTQIRDVEALRPACAELGLSLESNAEARGYAGALHKGDYVIRLKGPYDVAMKKQTDGSFGFTADLWAGHV